WGVWHSGPRKCACETGCTRRSVWMLDPKAIQKDFPILNRQVNGKRLVYLDNAATTQKPRAVIQAETDYYEKTNSNTHRGIHTLSEEATRQYEDVREKVAQFIGTSST